MTQPTNPQGQSGSQGEGYSLEDLAAVSGQLRSEQDEDVAAYDSADEDAATWTPTD
ncbi:hypothetical protein [Spirillospora sp. CA-128828]|uniref:hypothetical protein n=1 Tax=Spirillospora sp. CA-128828 TaxID=3240033 RepID=UPI003D8B37AE